MTIIGSSVLQRDPGATVVVAPYGPRGPVIAGTSATPVLIANGSVTFTMNEYGLGFTPGVRVRATAIEGSNQWVEGVVTAFDDPDLTIMADLHSGGDIFYSWQITVAGQPGVAGPQGPKGDTGEIPEAPMNNTKYARIDGQWANITAEFASKAPIDSPTFTGDPKLENSPATADNDKSIATTEFVKANIAALTTGFQPLDADLTSIAGATAIGSLGLHYRKTASNWVPLTMGSGITLDTATNTLNVTAGGGNVSASGSIVADDIALWASSNTIKSTPIATWRTNATFAGTFTFNGTQFDILGANASDNGYRFKPQAAGAGPQIIPTGTDANIHFMTSSKGSAGQYFYTDSFSRVALALMPTGAATDTFLQIFPGISKCELRPSVDGRPINIWGRTDASAVPAGMIGEYFQVGPASGGPLGYLQWYAIGGGTIPAGDWDIWVSCAFAGMGGLALGSIYLAVSEDAANPVLDSMVSGVSGYNGDWYGSTVIIRRNFNAPKIFYCLVYSSYNGYTVNNIYIRARRRS